MTLSNNYIKYWIILVSMMILTSCYSDYYVLNQRSTEPVSGIKMSEYGSFEQTAMNAFILKENSATGFGREYLTNYHADMTLNMIKGDSIVIALRTISENYPEDSGIRIGLSTSEILISERGRRIYHSKDITLAEEGHTRLQFIHDGNNVKIKADCDEIEFRTALPATEYVIVQTPPGTEAQFYGIQIAEVLSE